VVGGSTKNVHFFYNGHTSFFYKEYVLISKKYQLHIAFATTHWPSGSIDAHNQKRIRRITKKEKSCYSD
jgi:hypothetical protein